MEAYEVKGTTKQELESELKSITEFWNKIVKMQQEGVIEFAIRNTTTKEEEPVPIEEGIAAIQKGIGKIKMKLAKMPGGEERLNEDNIGVQEKEVIRCKSCGGTKKVQIICSACIENAVLRVSQRENLAPVRTKKESEYARRLKFHMEN